jgi:hypothetical protein
MVRILAGAAVFVLCGAMQISALLVRPLSGKELEDTVFHLVAYIVPEVVATALSVYLIQAGWPSNAKEDGRIIQRLYREAKRDPSSRTPLVRSSPHAAPIRALATPPTTPASSSLPSAAFTPRSSTSFV